MAAIREVDIARAGLSVATEGQPRGIAVSVLNPTTGQGASVILTADEADKFCDEILAAIHEAEPVS